ncbi:MAG TPA: luciferase family protein, partial [Thermomonospora sp.]|nr:luciferase family protein [Thermomonospora sp.]
MAAKGSGATSYADRVMARLESWPSMRRARAGCGIGTGLGVGACQVVHLHSGDEAELLLTRPVVDRLQAVLLASGRVSVQPGGHWIRVGLHTESDVTLVLTLASLAIKAALDSGCVGTGQCVPCGAARPRAQRPGTWGGLRR